MKGLILFALFVSNIVALTFLTPPSLAAFGKIHSPLYQQLSPFVDQSIYGKNVSIVIATDVAGCDASLTPAAGKVVWLTTAPCASLGRNYPEAQKWFNFQEAGAIGIIETMFGSNTEFETGNIFTGGNNNRNNVIPAVVIRNVKNWHFPQLDPTNPWVGLEIFGHIGNPNITARFDRPEANEAVRDLQYPTSVYGFIYYTGIALSFVALIIVSGKMFLFVSAQGLQLSMAQIVLALLALSLVFLLLFLLWGPWMAVHALTFAPVSFFQWHYLPYWYSAVALYAFYLAEVSFLSSSSGGSLKVFKWPAVIVCSLLWIMEVIEGSLFAAYVPGVDIPVVLELICAMYLTMSTLLIILVIAATVLLVRAAAGTESMKNLMIRLCLTSFALVLLLIASNLNFYFIANQNLGHGPQWGEYGPTLAGCAGLWWSTPLASILIALSFSVSTTKEIEISKSGTSSTSSLSSSSKSSSSSSASSDPVIEL